MDLVEAYKIGIIKCVDAFLQEAFALIGVSLEDVKNQRNRFQHIMFPDGRQEWRWDGQRLVWLEPMKSPSYGLMIYGIRGQK